MLSIQVIITEPVKKYYKYTQLHCYYYYYYLKIELSASQILIYAIFPIFLIIKNSSYSIMHISLQFE